MKSEVRKKSGEGGMWLNSSQPAVMQVGEVEEILQTSATRGLSTQQATERSEGLLSCSYIYLQHIFDNFVLFFEQIVFMNFHFLSPSALLVIFPPPPGGVGVKCKI